MSLTASTMLALESVLPRFELPLVDDPILQEDPFNKGVAKLRSSDLDDRPVLLMVLCAHCPFVKHVEEQLSTMQEDYLERVQIIAISSNSISTHPQDAPKYLACQAKNNGWTFPYLFDQDHSLAKSLKAACTPEFFLFSGSLDGQHRLKYRGQLDESRPGNNQLVTGNDLRVALNAVLLGDEIPLEQRPSIGCNIKWQPGNEPEWFK